VDKRTDLWAFGCILYECLTGKAPFKGETITETVAKILEGTPDWDLLPPNTPWRAKDLLRRCLQRNPKERLRDIGDARIEIMEARSQPAVQEPLASTKGLRTWKAIALLLGLVVIGMAATIIYSFFRTTPAAPVVRSRIDLPAGTQLIAGTEPSGKLLTQNRTELALSPDGRYLVYSASSDGQESNARLYRHALENAKGEEIPGTEGGRTPFFSPDGKWIGFWAQNKLWKVPASGGIPSVLCNGLTLPPMGASWRPDGRIAIGTYKEGLQAVDAAGGKQEKLTALDVTKEASHRLPQFLPNGKALLFTVMPLTQGTQAHIEVLSLESGTRKVLIEEGADARYVSTGHLVYVHEGTLMAVPFNSDRLELRGQAVPVAKGVKQAINLPFWPDNSGAGQFAISQSGLLVYASGGIAPDADIEFVWLDRQGKVEPLGAFGKRPASNPRISPDGRKFTYTTEGLNGNVWVYDLARHVATKLTSEGRAIKVIWTPDGDRVVFDFWRAGNPNLSWMRWDGGGSIEPLNEPMYASQYPGSWSKDGRYLAFVASDPPTSYDIYLLRMEDRQATPFIKTKFSEGWPIPRMSRGNMRYTSHRFRERNRRS